MLSSLFWNVPRPYTNTSLLPVPWLCVILHAVHLCTWKLNIAHAYIFITSFPVLPKASKHFLISRWLKSTAIAVPSSSSTSWHTLCSLTEWTYLKMGDNWLNNNTKMKGVHSTSATVETFNSQQSQFFLILVIPHFHYSLHYAHLFCVQISVESKGGSPATAL